MTATSFTVVFLAALAVSLSLQLWLAQRHAVHVRAHRGAVPPPFAGQIALAAHQKAADYTIARTRFAMVEMLFDTGILLALTQAEAAVNRLEQRA